MKVSNIKKRLFLGTMFLYLLGSTHPLEASLPESIFFAQTNSKVSGTVKDATGVVPGANLIEKGNPTNGTVSDINGNFSISIPEGSTLVVSAIGYKTQEITITNPSAQLNILLEEDVLLLDDVVVTALGIRRDRKALGYGLEEVKGEAFTKAREINVINSMAGRVAGLVVSQTAGGPSGSTRVLLRGNTEITGNNQPLYVVDGVPLDNTNYGSAGTYGGYDLGDGISAINPDLEPGVYKLTGKAADNKALYFYSNGELVTDLDVTFTAVTVLFEGHHYVSWDYEDGNPNKTFNLIGKDVFAAMSPGTVINIYYSLNPDAGYWQMQTTTAWWTQLPGTGTTDLVGDGVIELVLTQEMLDLIQAQDGFLCVGHGYYVDRVTLD